MDWGGILAPVCDWTLENGNGAVPGKIDKGYTTSNWANMVLNKQAVRECAALAHLFRDQLVLGFFGFVAPKINNSPDCFRAEDGIRDWSVTGVQTCALPI